MEMDRRLKKALPLLGALVFLMVGAALAVPSITVNVQGIGAGSNAVQNPIQSVDIKWDLNPTNPDLLDNLNITIHLNTTVASSLSSGTLYIKFYEGSTPHVYKYDITSTINDGDTIQISGSDVASTLGVTSNDLESILPKIDRIAVVYQGS
ncbi:hypothetical protein [Thermococcus sp. AM4]|uniref:hypothetical protein n=1 Tax=Thermococcus sp. (strain AM4) TaxID=246969 RepID=UPI0011D1A9F0|nr:hypothetical protein [Thermococcus sp. AM4]